MEKVEKVKNSFAWRALRYQYLRFLSVFNHHVAHDPLLITGSPKSGTSVIAAAYAEMVNQSLTLDLRCILEPNLSLLLSGRMKFNQLVERYSYEFRSDVIKEPWLSCLLPDVLDTYPDSFVVFIVRHPIQNVRSILERLGLKPLNGHTSISSLPWMSSDWLSVLKGGAVKTDDYVRNLALRWVEMVNNFHQIGTERKMIIRYEDFIANKLNVLKKINDKINNSIWTENIRASKVQYGFCGKYRENPYDLLGFDNAMKIYEITRGEMQQFDYTERNVVDRSWH